MPAPFIEFKRRLRWADADAAGRLHFPRIFEIVEEAESELLRGLDWPMDVRRKDYDFPRVHLECQFHRILALDAPFRLLFTVGKLGRTSIRYDYKSSTPTRTWRLKGTMTVVSYGRSDGESRGAQRRNIRDRMKSFNPKAVLKVPQDAHVL